MLGKVCKWCPNGCGKTLIYHNRNTTINDKFIVEVKPKGYYCEKCGYYVESRKKLKNAE